jgi:hypothetical protein
MTLVGSLSISWASIDDAIKRGILRVHPWGPSIAQQKGAGS